MNTFYPLAGFFVCLLAGHVQANVEIERTPTPNAKPLLLTAIQSPTGEAHGVLTGELAEAITARFKATSPIYIDVSVLKRYRQPGCSRLSVVFWQEGVRLPDLPSPHKQTVEFGINYCLDGMPPGSLE
jgi:hypothetical protein